MRYTFSGGADVSGVKNHAVLKSSTDLFPVE
jgi:hypothetical protein